MPQAQVLSVSPPLFLDLKSAHVSLCVCVCVYLSVACMRLPSLLCLGSCSAGWLPVSITSSVFATLNHSTALSLCPLPIPSSLFILLLPGVWMRGMSWGSPETGTGNTDDNKGCKPGSSVWVFLLWQEHSVPSQWIHSRPGDNLLCTLSKI